MSLTIVENEPVTIPVDPIPDPRPPLTFGRSFYDEADFKAAATFLDQHKGEPLEEVYVELARFLSARQHRLVSSSAAKNMVTRGRALGIIPKSEFGLARDASKARAKSKSKPKPQPKAPKVEVEVGVPFDAGMTAEELVEVICSVVYADSSSVPVHHLGPMLRFHQHAQEFLDALR